MKLEFWDKKNEAFKFQDLTPQFFPVIIGLCKKLDDDAIPSCIVQSDFHDNNIVIDEVSKKLTFIDLGEVVISHPFFSLVGCLEQAVRHHALKKEGYP